MYPVAEVRAAFRAAIADGADPPAPDDSTAVVWLERHGYLPRDRARVERVVAEWTEAARQHYPRPVAALAARRARSARHHRMKPHRTIVIRSA